MVEPCADAVHNAVEGCGGGVLLLEAVLVVRQRKVFLEMGNKEPLHELGYWGEKSDGPVTVGLVGRHARFEDGDYAAHFPQSQDLDGVDGEIYDHGEIVESLCA